MSCHQLMSTNYVVCSPGCQLGYLHSLMEGLYKYAVVIDGCTPKGIIPITRVKDLWATSSCSAENSLVPVSRCTAQDSLGYAGARMLQDGSSAALVYRGAALVGVVALLDILQALLSASANNNAHRGNLLLV